MEEIIRDISGNGKVCNKIITCTSSKKEIASDLTETLTL